MRRAIVALAKRSEMGEDLAMPDRRAFIMASAGLVTASCVTGVPAAPSPFVRRDGSRFILDGRPHRYVGANMWYAAYLGAEGNDEGQNRLKREFDRLAGAGISNLRILASSEASPLKNSVTPTFRDKTSFNETLLKGLDFTLAEMAKRGLRAVLYLTNFWEWSGGMMAYLHWHNGGQYIDMNDPAHPWPAFADFNAGFYNNEAAMADYRRYIAAVVGRLNSITGIPYAEDRAIMSWQLANEPRPGGSKGVVYDAMPAFNSWVNETAAYIKSLDPNHMVSTGSEGLQGCLNDPECVTATHRSKDIDYLTAHIWPENWSWVDARNLAGTFETGRERTQDYLDRHVALARRLDKPLVIEEFGFPRDDASYGSESTTRWRDRFYSQIFDAAKTNPIIAGTSFWAWGGEGRSTRQDYRYSAGAARLMGDPPHEPQGWYSVFDADASTINLIRSHADAVKASTG